MKLQDGNVSNGDCLTKLAVQFRDQCQFGRIVDTNAVLIGRRRKSLAIWGIVPIAQPNSRGIVTTYRQIITGRKKNLNNACRESAYLFA